MDCSLLTSTKALNCGSCCNTCNCLRGDSITKSGDGEAEKDQEKSAYQMHSETSKSKAMGWNSAETKALLGLKNNANNSQVDQHSGGSEGICLLRESPFRILRVAEKGHVREFTRIVSKDPSTLNSHDGRKRQAVHQAAMKNQIGILQVIVQFQGDLNAVDISGSTPLHLACESQALEAIDFLLSNGADGNILNGKCMAAIHTAAEGNKVESLRILAKHTRKLDVNLSGEGGRTALALACIHDHVQCVEILMEEMKASPLKPCSHSYLPIHEACKHASWRSLKILLGSCEKNHNCPADEMMNFPDIEGNFPIHAAIHGSCLQTVQLCLESGARISKPQQDLSTAVHLACSQGSVEIVKLLFTLQPEEKEQCLNSCDLEKKVPVMYAAMFDHVELLEYLISQGACLNLVDKDRKSPLHLCASRNAWQAMKLILKDGGDASLQDKDGLTVLHTIIKFNGNLNKVLNSETKMCFIPILEIKDKNGNTALHYAAKYNQIESFSTLLNLGASITTKNSEGENVFHLCCRYGRSQIITQILQLGQFPAVINDSNRHGLTPYHLAAAFGHHRVLQVLMKKGAILHRDHLGRTPLAMASESGHTEVMSLILNTHSHLIDMTDKQGNTPLHTACINNQAKAVDLLLKLNCQLTYNEDGYSALDYALYNKFVEVVYIMVTHKYRRDEVLGLTGGKYPCVLKSLIILMPAVAKSVLDQGIKASEDIKPDSPDYHIYYDFKWLSHLPYADSGSGSKNDFGETLSPEKTYLPILNEMVANGRVSLLSHELSNKYLHSKWHAYGKYFQCLNLFCYLVYLSVLSLCSVSSWNFDDSFFILWRDYYVVPHSINATAHERQTYGLENISSSANNLYKAAYKEYMEKMHGGYSEEWENSHFTPFHVLGVITLINVIREIINVARHGIKYCQDFETWIWWSMNLSTLLVTTVLLLEHFVGEEYASLHLFNPSIAIASFLGWFYLLLLLQRFDAVGLYVSMFLEILRTLVRVLLIFSILIVAFGMAFFILLSNGNHIVFSNYPMAILRAFSMMLGDLDFMNTFVYPYHCEKMEATNRTHLKGYTTVNECRYPRRVPHEYATFCMVFLYMILMPILLMNLLIGLAVGDIDLVRKNAELKRLTMQVRIHTNLEKSLPECFLRRVDKTFFVKYPNREKRRVNIMKHVVAFFQPKVTRKEENEEVDIESDDLMNAILENNATLLHLSSEMDTMKSLVQLICQKMNVSIYINADEGTAQEDEITSPRDKKLQKIPRIYCSTRRKKQRPRPAFQRSVSTESGGNG